MPSVTWVFEDLESTAAAGESITTKRFAWISKVTIVRVLDLHSLWNQKGLLSVTELSSFVFGLEHYI